MKKYFLFLLILTLCISLCSCGSNREMDNHGKSDAIDGDVQANHAFLSDFYGVWNYKGDYKDSYPFSALEVNADGTCLVDGQRGTWKMNEQTTDDRLYVDVFVNAENIATVMIYLGWNDQMDLVFPSLPLNPGDRWVNKAAAEAVRNEIMKEWGSDLFGQWEVYTRDNVGKIDPLVFIEDGTVRIGEQIFNWRISDTWSRSDIELDLILSDNEQDLYDMKLWREDGDLHGQLYNGEYIVLYKPSYYEILTITLDNIYDYFEMTTSWKEEYNGFDELEQVETQIRFALKEPYASRISYVNDDTLDDNVVDNGVIEWSYQLGSFDVVLLEDHTFILENCISAMTCSDIYSGNGSFTSKTYDFTVPYGWRVYIPGRDLDVEKWIAHEGNSYYDYEIVRVKLDLYLIPE